jgi:hypothetical protein
VNPIATYFNAAVDDLATAFARSAPAANSSDIGTNRESALLRFLGAHLPRRLSAALGGRVLGSDGSESRQVDVLVSNDVGLRFSDNTKNFAVAESVAAAISVKSTLDSDALRDSFDVITSIPEPDPQLLTFPRLHNPATALSQMLDSHPSNWVFAYDGVGPEVTRDIFLDALNERPESKTLGRTAIVVNGRYTITYHPVANLTSRGETIDPVTLHIASVEHDARGYGLALMINNINAYVDWLGHMSISVHTHLQRTYGEP